MGSNATTQSRAKISSANLLIGMLISPSRNDQYSLTTFNLARNYVADEMKAYSASQQAEFSAEVNGFAPCDIGVRLARVILMRYLGRGSGEILSLCDGGIN